MEVSKVLPAVIVREAYEACKIVLQIIAGKVVVNELRSISKTVSKVADDRVVLRLKPLHMPAHQRVQRGWLNFILKAVF